MASRTSGESHSTTERPNVIGSWRLTVFEADGPPTFALATCGADGTLVTAEHPIVTPPGAPGMIFTSSGHGAWVASGPDTAILIFVVLGSDEQGNLFGIANFRVTITLSLDGQTFTGEFVATLDDALGNTMATFPGTLQGTRIIAEPLGVPLASTSADITSS